MDGYTYLQNLPHVQKLNAEKRVTLLLGTDRHIDGGTPDQETRVCLTPYQVHTLRNWLASHGIVLTLYIIKGLGISSGYDDATYLRPGDRCLQEHELSTLSDAPDVVHALKEPCHYEAHIPGSFIRIGALHTGKFEFTSGCASLLKQQNFSAIFDGSAIGGFSHTFNGGYIIPIRSSMSVFAGKIAADLVLDHCTSLTKIIIVGGGVVGVCAAEQILQRKKGASSPQIVIFEAKKERVEQLMQLFSSHSSVQIKQSSHVDSEDLHAASGFILAAFQPGVPSPKVVEVCSLNTMAQGACVVDVSADEGGSIAVPQGETIQQAIGKLQNAVTYIGDTHMPRKYPGEASEAHGKAVLPYLAILLFLTAREGGARQAVEYIERYSSQVVSNYFEALICDLSRGLAFSGPDPICIHEHVVKDIDGVCEFLKSSHFASMSVELASQKTIDFAAYRVL